jgi:SAM-dependent methyltransferase
MQKVINIINSLDFDTVCVYGVGVPFMFFDRIKGEKTGVDNFDKNKFPRSWSGATISDNILSKPNKKKFDVVIINDSKHYKDLTKYFKQALKNIKEEGKIVFTHSMPNTPQDITEEPKKHQIWCGDVQQFILELISKGGYKVTSFDDDLGVSIVEIDETKEPKNIDVQGFEEVYFDRKNLMNN